MVQPKRFCCTIFPLILALLLAAGPAHAQAGKAALVVVSEVTQEALSDTLTLVGTAEPQTRSLIASEVDGIVREFPVEEGDFVSKGQLIAQLDVKTLRIKLGAAEAVAERYRQELEEMKAGPRPMEIEQEKATMLEAQAERIKAERELKRIEDLYRKNFASQQDLNFAEAAAKAALQKELQTKAAYELSLEGYRKERIARAKALLEAQLAEVERLKDEINKASIKAPFSGSIVADHIEVGEWVAKGGPVVEMIDLQRVHITVNLPERYIDRLSTEDRAEVRFDALPGETKTGKVAYIIHQADVAARTFPVKIEVNNDDYRIKSGMFARVVLTVGSSVSKILVPKDAIVRRGPANLIFVVADGTVKQVPVQEGIDYGEKIEVKGELTPGQLVVVRGNERLRDGQPVKITDKM